MKQLMSSASSAYEAIAEWFEGRQVNFATIVLALATITAILVAAVTIVGLGVVVGLAWLVASFCVLTWRGMKRWPAVSFPAVSAILCVGFSLFYTAEVRMYEFRIAELETISSQLADSVRADTTGIARQIVASGDYLGPINPGASESWGGGPQVRRVAAADRVLQHLAALPTEVRRPGYVVAVLAKAAIESGWNPKALSPENSGGRGRAGGLWQILEATGKTWGLKSGDRFDVDASTVTTLRHDVPIFRRLSMLEARDCFDQAVLSFSDQYFYWYNGDAKRGEGDETGQAQTNRALRFINLVCPIVEEWLGSGTQDVVPAWYPERPALQSAGVSLVQFTSTLVNQGRRLTRNVFPTSGDQAGTNG